MIGELVCPPENWAGASQFWNWRTAGAESQSYLERVQSAELLLLPWELVESCHRHHKPKLRSTAVSFLSAYADKVILLSNDSTRLPSDLQSMLQQQGIKLPAERILLAGHQTLLYLQQAAPKTPLCLVAEPRLQGLAHRLGLRRAGLDAEMLVLMQDQHIDARKLALAATLVRQGVDVLVANAEPSSVSSDGWVTPGAWSLLLAVLAAAERMHHPVGVMGMPSCRLYIEAMAIADVPRKSVLALGIGGSQELCGAADLGVATVAICSPLDLGDLVMA